MKIKFKYRDTPRLLTLRARVARFFSITKMVVLRTLGGIAMFTVFVLSAFAAMRLAIHGREVSVPTLSNLSDEDAAATLKKLGLHLSVENRFYAASVPANHVLSQSPLPGARVRRGWEIHVTESLGAQQVPVPDVTGQDAQPVTFLLKRLQLEVGTVAHIPAPSPAGAVIAQSPPPNVAGLDGPRVSILVADDQPPPSGVGFVMPSIVGLTVATANSRLASAGLHIAPPTPPPDAVPPVDTAPAAIPSDPAIPPTVEPVVPAFRGSSVITSQSPLPGHRVSRADTIHVTVVNLSQTPTPNPTAP
jgi:beta-lactam-binding protein with PASTA domain